MTAHVLIESVLILLFLACGVGLAVKRLAHVPYTAALVVVGLVLSFFHFEITKHIVLSKDIIFLVFLPPLLFVGAYDIELDHLKQDWRSILLFSVPGVIVSTALIGFGLHYIIGLELKYALLFGALISPTDPISVVAVFREISAPRRLRVLMEGESLFNDGTGVVVFAVLFTVLTAGGASGGFDLHKAIGQFILVVMGGVAVGYVIGKLANMVLKPINDHLWEVTATVVVVYGTYLLAEWLHVSGVIAVVVMGLWVGNYGRRDAMSIETRHTVENFWEVVDFIINSLLFLMIGLEMQIYPTANLITQWWPILAAILVVSGVRLVNVGLMAGINNLAVRRPEKRLPVKWTVVFFWGGLRGSIPIALVLGLPRDFPQRELLFSLTFMVCLFTLIVQGVTMKPLLRALGIGADKGVEEQSVK